MTFSSLLVANRGEIAVRVIRTARELGLRTIAVYSEADAGAPHALMADEAVEIGPAPVAESYLSVDRILAAARKTGAEAIHPGYGFLSENADFARAVEAAGIVFVGPSPEAIAAMGLKAEAKRLMLAAGVPCVPGYEGEDQSDAALTAAAGEVGFPVMVKASAGGGGRGMRLVASAEDLPEALALARSEAVSAFGAADLIVEKAIQQPRHVEMQVFADKHGNVIHLGERDCSVQRRHQKMIEEAPCPVMSEDLRARMGAAACDAARAVGYVGAGTVEFLLDPSGAFYFLEMNTRLQVEHPVTEMVTGLDLVAMQIAVAQGEPLGIAQKDVRLAGHAIEARLYAEDPANNYLPATGRIALWRPADAPGVRIDAGIASGQEISPYYDPMLAKIVAHGPTRMVALARLKRGLADTALLGTVTNTAFLVDVLESETFEQGSATTAFLEERYPGGYQAPPPDSNAIALAAALISAQERDSALKRAGFVARDLVHWSSAPVLPRPMTLQVGEAEISLHVAATPRGWTVDTGETVCRVENLETDGPSIRADVDGARVEGVWAEGTDELFLAIGARQLTAKRPREGRSADADGTGGRILAPMPGLMLDLHVAAGDRVKRGQTLAILEAMKMQHQIVSTIDGRVLEVHVSEGQQLVTGAPMIEIEEESE